MVSVTSMQEDMDIVSSKEIHGTSKLQPEGKTRKPYNHFKSLDNNATFERQEKAMKHGRTPRWMKH